ncbi:MAG: hypothetical protein GY805_36180 [Chloroflexi bacterium]|nr:hypothetical protein [Chloroflexota bacterium]
MMPILAGRQIISFLLYQIECHLEVACLALPFQTVFACHSFGFAQDKPEQSEESLKRVSSSSLDGCFKDASFHLA